MTVLLGIAEEAMSWQPLELVLSFAANRQSRRRHAPVLESACGVRSSNHFVASRCDEIWGTVCNRSNSESIDAARVQWVLTRDRNFPVANCELGRALELKGHLEAALREYGIAFPNVGDKQCRAAFESLQLQLKK